MATGKAIPKPTPKKKASAKTKAAAKPAAKPKAAAKPRPLPRVVESKGSSEIKSPKTRATKAALPPVTPPPVDAPAPDVKRLSSDLPLTELAHETFTIAMDERGNRVGENQARFKRGEVMLRLEGLSRGLKIKMEALLEDLNERTLALAAENQIEEYEVISKSEMTATKAVVHAFGSSGEFQHVYGVNQVTGDPLVNDAGEAPQVSLTRVPINKLYPLVEYADDLGFDELASFAHRHSEKVVKKTKAVAKNLVVPFEQMMKKVNALREERPNPMGSDLPPIKLPPREKETLMALRSWNGEAPEPDIASLKTSRAWYEGTWLPLKKFVDALAGFAMPNTLYKTKNGLETSNVLTLETILTQFYHPSEDDGVQRVLASFVARGDLTEAKANEFLNKFAFNPDTDEWERQVVDEEVEQLSEDLKVAHIDPGEEYADDILDEDDNGDDDGDDDDF